MSKRVLSSTQTFWMKFIFPTIWISLFGMGTLGLFLGNFHGRNDCPPEEWLKWVFLLVWLVGTPSILWGCGRLKRVRIDDSALYVSNYFKEIRIPFDAISKVSENRWINIHPVTIYFRFSTTFGDRIIFMPTSQLWTWCSHPVVSELRALAHI